VCVVPNFTGDCWSCDEEILVNCSLLVDLVSISQIAVTAGQTAIVTVFCNCCLYWCQVSAESAEVSAIVFVLIRARPPDDVSDPPDDACPADRSVSLQWLLLLANMNVLLVVC